MVQSRSHPPFIGRQHELQELGRAVDAALAGNGSLWMVLGEGGIGKTRLAREVAAGAARRGAQVLWGQCWDGEGAPAFWPWIQVLRALCAVGQRAGLARAVSPATAAIIAQIAPEVRALCGEVPAPPPLEPAAARFRCFDAVATLFGAASAAQPLVIVLDDLHWADASSLLLLEFVAREAQAGRLLLLGTARDECAALPGGLDRVGRHHHRLPLRGLDESELARFMAVSGSADPSDAAVRALYRRTAGNPFFAGEILAMHAATGALAHDAAIGIPHGVRDAIRQRWQRLSLAAREVLGRAAVIGGEFDVPLLAQIATPAVAGTAELLAALDEAADHRLITPIAPARYAFAHALVREALYEELGTATRSGLHHAVVEALERTGATDLATRTAELAHHASLSGPAGDPEKTVTYARRAAEQCAEVLAYEAAAKHYEIALQALALCPEPAAAESPPERPAAERRCEIMLALGDMLKRAGDAGAARGWYLRAAQLARAAGAAHAMARAALSLPLQVALGAADGDVVRLCDDALARLPPGEHALRAGTLARLAVEVYASGDPARCLVLTEEAVALARRAGDPAMLAFALTSHLWSLWTPGRTAERVAVAGEVVQLGERAGDRERVLTARGWRAGGLLELGDVAGADREIGACAALAAELRQPQFVWYVAVLRAMRALLDGRLAEAERLAADALNLGTAQTPSAALIYGAQLLVLRREQGRARELEPLLGAIVAQHPELAGARAALAVVHAESGRLAEAAALFGPLAATDFAAVPLDGNWLNAIVQLAEVCVCLADRARAGVLSERLAPYADRVVVLAGAAACWTPVRTVLGRLAAASARWADAASHFEAALQWTARCGARPAQARTQYAYAEMLLQRGRPEDRDRAHALLEAAAETFVGCDMSAWAARARAARAAHEGAAPIPSGAPRSGEASDDASPPGHRFCREGEYWTLTYARQTTRIRDAKGLRYLAQLLRDPDREYHVADLVLAVDGAPPPGDIAPVRGARRLARVGGASASPILDRRARAEYRARVAALREALEEAERFNDLERAGNARHELELITAQLSAAYGLHTARQSVQPVERLRKAVGNRIRTTLSRIRHEHVTLWRHLSTAVKTGTFCSYRPEHPMRWTVDDGRQ